ncbi:MAG: phosphoribosyltransferase family protein [Candidatus Roizmanbacteria bacterium]
MIDILFPSLCLGCGKLGSYICLSCEASLVVYDRQKCIYCHEDSYLGFTHPQCVKHEGIDGVFSVFMYNNTLKRVIKNIKYRFVSDAFSDVFRLLTLNRVEDLLCLCRLVKNLSLQPVPLHKQKQKQRGFNQTIYVSEYLSTHLNLPIIEQVERVRYTLPQAQIHNLSQRYKNMIKAFSIKNKEMVARKNILIIDDVITSGNTIKSVAKVLKKAGANKVFAFSLARG